MRSSLPRYRRGWRLWRAVITSDLGICRVANLPIECNGDGAEDHAQGRTDELKTVGNDAGRLLWLGIAAAVRELPAVGLEGTVR